MMSGVGGTKALHRNGEALMTPNFAVDVHDWDFLAGRWTVRHRRLKARLAGSTEWEEFAGTSVNWPTLGGEGNVDDNVIELPDGTYRAVTIRALDAKAGQWLIWWLDQRDRKSTRLNSSHSQISYAVFCLKKKKKK